VGARIVVATIAADTWRGRPIARAPVRGAAVGVACLSFADCPAEGPGPGGMMQRYDRCENGSCTGKLCNEPMKGWVPCEGL